MREVVVTGMGVVSPLGASVERFAERMLAGDSGIRDIRGTLVPEEFPVPYAGVVDRDELSPAAVPDWDGASRVPECNLFAAHATAEALAAVPAGLPFDAVVYGTAEGLNFEVVQESFRDGPEVAWEEARAESSVEVIARQLARRGHGELPSERRIAFSSACASGSQAIGMAFHRIRSGRWRRALAGGVDTRVLPANLMSFHLLSALATEEGPPERASRPFSIDRTGFVRSEGAASLVLEDRAEAERRGAEILCRVTGYAHTTDAFHFTEGREDCAAVIRAMEAAVGDAGRAPAEIDVVSAHGTSTPMNDRLETLAIKRVFGERAYDVPVTALKSQLGHSTVAAGAVEAVSVIVMLRGQRIAPTINYNEEEIDPQCDLDYVPNRARDARFATVLSNSLGFGGHNACVLFEHGG